MTEWRRAAALLALLAAAGPVPAAGRSPDRPAAGAAEARMALFDHVWRTVRDKYYDPAFNGVDWTAVGARYRPRVGSIGSDAEYYRLVRAMLGELRDAHTRLLDPRQALSRRSAQSLNAGIILFEVEGESVVFDVRPGGPAAEAGLRPGMRVLTVNGVPVGEALRRAQAEVGPSSSRRAALILAYLTLISGAPDQPLRLRLADGDRPPFEVALPRRATAMAPRFESRRLPSGHLYVRFDRFRAPVAARLRDALEQARDAPGLILDLRSNTGGDGKEGMKAIGPLLEAPTLVARLATRTGKPPSALGGLVKLPLRLTAGSRGGQLYRGPVMVLVNQGTASTSEVIAASLQERGRATIVGAPSCGCALGVLRYRRLADGGTLAISEVGLLSGLGRRIEGQGVAPDLSVDVKVDDLRLGRDPVLEAAVRRLEAVRPTG